MTVTIFPEGMTDPDERDRWLEARDTREIASRDRLDSAVMATIPPDQPTPATSDLRAQIAARNAYLRLPFWQRWRTPRPPGLIDRHPTGVLHK